MNNEIYIIDCDNQVIGNEIQKLCVMADIQPPDLPRPTAEFIKENFGNLPFHTMTRAFNYWLAGKMPNLRKPPKINVHFISLLLREYIEIFRHNIKMKPRVMLEAPKHEPTEEELKKLHKKSYDQTFEDFKRCMRGDNRLIPYIMHLIGERKKDEGYPSLTPIATEEAREWLINYEKRRDMEIAKNSKRGFEIIKKIQLVKMLPTSLERLDTIAIAYWHFKKRMAGEEEAWY